jgi:hypothetical protein
VFFAAMELVANLSGSLATLPGSFFSGRQPDRDCYAAPQRERLVHLAPTSWLGAMIHPSRSASQPHEIVLHLKQASLHFPSPVAF